MTPGARLDLHVHSDRSPDSRLTLDTIVALVQRAGLGGFALTDHNTVAGHPALREIAVRHPELLVVPGVEISTDVGHLLALGVRSAPPAHRSLEATIGWVRDHGGEPVLAHPYRWTHGVGARAAGVADVGAIESVNGQSSPRANRAADDLARRRGIGRTGGSDAHTAEGVGRAFTIVDGNPATADDLLEAIRRGRTEAGGQSLGLSGRLRWSWRNAVLRARRGFRAV
jgi:predicted metal-dependent phosphoesterase TrpH